MLSRLLVGPNSGVSISVFFATSTPPYCNFHCLQRACLNNGWSDIYKEGWLTVVLRFFFTLLRFEVKTYLYETLTLVVSKHVIGLIALENLI